MTATTFSRQNDAGSRACTPVVVLVLESKALYNISLFRLLSVLKKCPVFQKESESNKMVLGYKISQFCTQNETNPGHKIRPLVLQGSKINNFCLKQGQGFKASAAHLLSPPPPAPHRPLLGL